MNEPFGAPTRGDSPGGPLTQAATRAGTVTLLFSDIEGSTRLLQTLGAEYASLLATHHALLRAALRRHDGREIDTAGDGFFIAFARARDAVAAAVAAQRALAAQSWPGGASVRVRMGMHTGEPIVGQEGFVGLDVHRAARICSAAAGGQVLLSESTRALADGELPAGVVLRDLGYHVLKDLHAPEHLFQLAIDDLADAFPPIGLDAQLLHNFPGAPTTLLGRDREIEEVKRLLLRDDVRAVTLTGPGGTGKTRLALAVAETVAATFEHGAWFVPLAALRDPSLVGPTIARTLGIPDHGARSIVESLAEFLRPRHALLVIDNFEQVIDAATLIAELLAACPRLDVLVTSRGPLRLRGEHEYPVSPLELPDRARWNDPEALRHSAATRLFVERAREARPDFVLAAENAPAVAEVCARLDGLPLALELAAARIRLFSPQALLARLGRRLDVLKGGARDLPERHQALRQTIAWSHDLLSASERVTFRRMAVFLGGATLEAVEAVCGELHAGPDVLEDVTALVDRSLVRREEDGNGETRLVMLETIREFGGEQLAAADEALPIGRAHAAHFVAFAQHAAQRLTGAEATLWLDRLDVEHDNLRAAMDFAESTADGESSLELCSSLWRFFIVRGHMREGRHRLERALRLPAAAAPSEARARVLFGLGTLTHELSDYDNARALIAEAHAIWRAVGDRDGIARALTSLGWIAVMQGHVEEGERLTREGLELHRELQGARNEAVSLNQLGLLCCSRGRPQEAIQLLRTSMRRFDALHDRRGLAYAQTHLGWVLALTADFAGSIAVLDEAFVTLTMLRDTQLSAWNLNRRGNVACLAGEFTRARPLLEESLRMWHEVGSKFGIAETLVHLGVVEMLSGRLDLARQLINEGLARFEAIASGLGIVEAMHASGALAVRERRFDVAARQLAGSLERMSRHDDWIAGAAVIEELAVLCAERDEPDNAAELLGAATGLRERTGTPVPPHAHARLEALAGTLGERIAERFDDHLAAGRQRAPQEAMMLGVRLASTTPPDETGGD